MQGFEGKKPDALVASPKHPLSSFPPSGTRLEDTEPSKVSIPRIVRGASLAEQVVLQPPLTNQHNLNNLEDSSFLSTKVVRENPYGLSPIAENPKSERKVEQQQKQPPGHHQTKARGLEPEADHAKKLFN